ncbi:HAMP domain-containing methyl-accepting chemotaxis protein [Denitromonas iodatirespirans]|uniref:Methyl-accepting chemotaxis protein n=1 Tax=Denitromonas iodatirespirans TaxID=2795389 RepID=A0A944D6U4_DENI1|nr:methyl-accepting chemotaxis protein [Denitromonas iodatirespirans]MBT0959562.1 methyl-accepting chemotaxis protein [Denitromonas iodatirespirans]
MNWLLNLAIRTKLLLAFGVMLVLLAALIAGGYSGLDAIQQAQKTLFERDMVISTELEEFRAGLNLQRANILVMQLESRRAEQEALEAGINTSSAELDLRLNTLATLGGYDPAFATRLDDIRQTLAAYRQARQQQIAMIYGGQVEQARLLGTGVQLDRFEKIRSLALTLDAEARQRGQAEIRDNEQRLQDTVRLAVLLGATALIAGFGMAVFLHRLIAVPLSDIAARAARIADGEIALAPALSGRLDEIGDLDRQFNRMSASLRDKAELAQRIAAGDLRVEVKQLSDKDILGEAFATMASSLRDKAELAQRIATGDLRVEVKLQSDTDALGQAFATMVNNLRELNRDIGEGVEVLAASAAEILTSTSQVATGATQTATAMSETATTVEEIKQTATLASQKAKSVAEVARQAAQVARGGSQAVEDTVEGMQHIREQMAQIAESIVRLSEQGQAIGEIIATVNDLSEQSNLLAVNASIEAAKAGEQGKGFAVVAQEVRSLAGQSKQATAQVRAILGDIQKATGSAVLATEQGSKAVEAGVRQSREAGEAIRQLADSIDDSAQAASQIAVSAQQQLAGMDQLAEATANIRVATAQNLDSTRQAETAAHNLNELGQTLKRQVARYRL